MIKSLEDVIEPDSDYDRKFNLSIKQLQFIQNDGNIKHMDYIIKLMKKYKLELEDVINIVEKHIQTEMKKQERNEARRLQKQQEQNNNNDDNDEHVKSNKRSSTRSSKQSSKRK